MKVISISDTHFGLESLGVESAASGLNTRSEDGLQAFDQVIDYAISNKIDIVIHSGDVFNHKNVSQSIVNAFYARVKRLTNAGIPIYILNGNHDSSKITNRFNGLDLAMTIGVPLVYTTRGGDYQDYGFVQIVSVSYWNTPEELVKEIEEHTKNVDWKRPVILVAHLQVHYEGSPGAFKAELGNTPLSVLISKPFSMVQLGHIHKPQVLNESPRVFYVGSLVRCTATEEHDKKGFWVSEFKGNKLISSQQIEVDCLKYLTFRGTMEHLKNIMKDKNIDFKNAIVRIQIEESEDPIDDAFLKDKFGSAFKYIVQKQSEIKTHNRILASAGIDFNTYVLSYFKEDEDKDELLSLIEELRNADQTVEK